MHVLHAHRQRTTEMCEALDSLSEMHRHLRLIHDGITDLAERPLDNRAEIEQQLSAARQLVERIQALREARFGALSHESLLRLHSQAESAEADVVRAPAYPTAYSA